MLGRRPSCQLDEIVDCLNNHAIEHEFTAAAQTPVEPAILLRAWLARFDANADASTAAVGRHALQLNAKSPSRLLDLAAPCIHDERFQDRRIRPLCHPS